jgi:hypothetical protein
MGCDIHTFAERRTEDGWVVVDGWEPFRNRNYSVFGFLAGVRNYSEVPPIAQPRGLPADASDRVKRSHDDWGFDGHSASWLSIDELLAFDYEATMEDRRVNRQVGPNHWDGSCTCEAGEGRQMTYRAFLGVGFFRDLAMLFEAGVDRIVFWFDN